MLNDATTDPETPSPTTAAPATAQIESNAAPQMLTRYKNLKYHGKMLAANAVANIPIGAASGALGCLFMAHQGKPLLMTQQQVMASMALGQPLVSPIGYLVNLLCIEYEKFGYPKTAHFLLNLIFPLSAKGCLSFPSIIGSALLATWGAEAGALMLNLTSNDEQKDFLDNAAYRGALCFAGLEMLLILNLLFAGFANKQLSKVFTEKPRPPRSTTIASTI